MKTHLEKIDFLRGIAILLVFVYHASLVIFGFYYKTYHYAGFWLDYKAIPKIDLLLLFTPLSYGGSGVSLFLIISGFLIHYASIKKDLQFNALQFYNKRFWRIYPPYLIALILFISTKGPFSYVNLFNHLFLVHNFNDDTIFSINPSFWSLALEAQLYVIYPLYLFLYKKMGNNKSFLVVVVITAVAIVIKKIFNINSQSFDKSVLNYWIIWVAGAYLANIYYNKKRVLQISGIQLALLLAAIVILQFTIISVYISFYLFAFFYVLLIDWFLPKNINVSNILYRFIISVGLCSYSIYLFHQPYLYELINFVRFGFYSFIITAPLCFLFLYFVARLTYKYIEQPSIKIGHRAYSFQTNKLKKYFLSMFL